MSILSLQHLLWLCLTLLFAAGCIGMRRFPTEAKAHRIFRLCLFVLILANELAWFAYKHFVAGVALADNLPLHLCDISILIMFATLVTCNRFLAELSYYAGVTGALMAVSVPAVSETGAIRLVAEARYFMTHIALVGAGFYFTFGRRYYPNAGAILRSYVAVLLYAALITPINLFLDTNYFFTISAPDVAFLQRHPHWLILSVAALSFLLFFTLMHLPFAWLRRVRAASLPG